MKTWSPTCQAPPPLPHHRRPCLSTQGAGGATRPHARSAGSHVSPVPSWPSSPAAARLHTPSRRTSPPTPSAACAWARSPTQAQPSRCRCSPSSMGAPSARLRPPVHGAALAPPHGRRLLPTFATPCSSLRTASSFDRTPRCSCQPYATLSDRSTLKVSHGAQRRRHTLPPRLSNDQPLPSWHLAARPLPPAHGRCPCSPSSPGRGAPPPLRQPCRHRHRSPDQLHKPSRRPAAPLSQPPFAAGPLLPPQSRRLAPGRAPPTAALTCSPSSKPSASLTEQRPHAARTHAPGCGGHDSARWSASCRHAQVSAP
jgi:hypothetical protein